MKFLPFAFFAVLLSAVYPAPGADDRYEIVGKALVPFLTIFAPSDSDRANRALSMSVRIEQMTNLPEELAGARAEIAVEYPDKLRLQGPVLGEDLILVRDDDKLWVSPGAKAKALLDAAVAGKELPPAEKKFKLGDFKLPIPEKQLVFLPMLFGVKDVGSEALDGQQCRVLDLTLMPPLAKALKMEGWIGRLWVRSDYTPARLTLAKQGWNVVLRFDRVQFSERLPESTWKPTPEQASDVLELEPKDYSRFLRAISGYKKKPKKEEPE